ncbi:unnamed protein product [Staurois parvus]|uniref:Uncharacterized protein n=1 Tax=Staurois parvus TaxID=386267 RepID=A0ABN9CEH9_9NEOB|nr:unnamed protein product [Staurois parvus]
MTSALSYDQLYPITANRTDHQGTDQCSPISATCQCLSMPPVSAHQCHLLVLISATYQCPSELSFSATYQCQSVPPISAHQCCLTVPASAV